MSEAPIDKAWRTRRAKKRVETRKKNKLHRRLSKVAKLEVRKRKKIQDLVARNLKRWWRRAYLKGPSSMTAPLKCEVCGESDKLGLSIHHIDPQIKKNDERYNLLKNKAPLCGTCHNIITYKKTQNPSDIIKAIKSRHENALRNGLLKS
jgi:hypothetical protein